MNLRSNIIIGLLAAGQVVQTAVTIAQEAQTVPLEVVLNGIMTTLDARRAFFQAAISPGAPRVNFMLVEGETSYGIQLLSVDVRLNAVKICNHGLVQTIPICQTPEIVGSAIKANGAGGSGLATTSGRQNNRSDYAGDSPEEANANPQTSDAGLAAGFPRMINNSGSNNDGSNNGGSNNDGTASTTDGGSDNSKGSSSAPQDQRYQWWIQEAQKIERARVETAQRVLDGEWQPYPLTPLTPPNTSPQLIGASGVFMEHGTGVIIAGK